LNLAIVSPNRDAYTETFIKAHKDLIRFPKVFYYGGGGLPKFSSKEGKLYNPYVLLNPFLIFKKIKNDEKGIDAQLFLNSLRKNKIDIILAEYGVTAAHILPVCKALKIPLVVHFHGYDASNHDVIARYAKEYLKVFEYASSIISVSKVMTEMLQQLGAPAQKIFLNTYGPNESFFTNKPDFQNQNFLAVGRFVDKKAPYYTILAFNETLKLFPDAKLLYAGEGPLLSMCKNLVHYLGIVDSVLFLGKKSHDDIRSLMNSSSAFVQHSITSEDGDMEGTPVAIIEAAAAGLPVISTIHAGIPDVVIHNKTGFLVKEHDVKSMALYMQKILQNSEIAKDMGKRGKEHINHSFSIDRHITNIENILKEAVDAY
jgi:colanic acid/amylovoran biosynthesis glycosyltransferase